MSKLADDLALLAHWEPTAERREAICLQAAKLLQALDGGTVIEGTVEGSRTPGDFHRKFWGGEYVVVDRDDLFSATLIIHNKERGS